MFVRWPIKTLNILRNGDRGFAIMTQGLSFTATVCASSGDADQGGHTTTCVQTAVMAVSHSICARACGSSGPRLGSRSDSVGSTKAESDVTIERMALISDCRHGTSYRPRSMIVRTPHRTTSLGVLLRVNWKSKISPRGEAGGAGGGLDGRSGIRVLH